MSAGLASRFRVQRGIHSANDLVLPDLFVRDEDGEVIRLYECQGCWALTRNPRGHSQAHDLQEATDDQP